MQMLQYELLAIQIDQNNQDLILFYSAEVPLPFHHATVMFNSVFLFIFFPENNNCYELFKYSFRLEN